MSQANQSSIRLRASDICSLHDIRGNERAYPLQAKCLVSGRYLSKPADAMTRAIGRTHPLVSGDSEIQANGQIDREDEKRDDEDPHRPYFVIRSRRPST